MKYYFILIYFKLNTVQVFSDVFNNEVYDERTEEEKMDLIAKYRPSYVKEILLTRSHNPHQMAVSGETLYFSINTGIGDYTPAVLDLKTKKIKTLRGVNEAYAISGDHKTGEVYFGGAHGLYKLNPKKKVLMKLGLKDLDVWWLVIKNHAPYFVKFPSLSVYYYTNRSVTPFKLLEGQSVHQFVFDKDENIYFINNEGLFTIQKEETVHKLLKEEPKFHSIATDNFGKVYMCSDDAIWVISQMGRKVKKIANLPGVLGMTFDYNNTLVYSDSHNIVRLVKVNQGDVSFRKHENSFILVN